MRLGSVSLLPPPPFPSTDLNCLDTKTKPGPNLCQLAVCLTWSSAETACYVDFDQVGEHQGASEVCRATWDSRASVGGRLSACPSQAPGVGLDVVSRLPPLPALRGVASRLVQSLLSSATTE